MSQLGWIDFSPDDRNKVKSVLALLSEPGTLDELGIGQIRDAYSDLLFPGISTIQTRAKYFIIVARILRDYQSLSGAQKKRVGFAKKYLADRENDVARILVQKHSEDEVGIIGRSMIEKNGVKQRPSMTYWTGLRIFELVRTSLSIADFCDAIDDDEQSLFDTLDALEGSDDQDQLNSRQLICLPNKSEKWFDATELSINLSHTEAIFLKNKLIGAHKILNSVPTQLLKNNLLGEVFKPVSDSEVAGFDLLADILRLSPNVDEKCKFNIQMAREFSLAMEGPHIRYNFLIAKHNNFEHKIKEYENDYQYWLSRIHSEKLFKNGSVDSWIDQASDGRHRVSEKSKLFVREVGTKIQAGKKLDELIGTRAEQNKGSRSLLKRKLMSDNWVGIRRLTYRWGTARTVLKDIQRGLDAKS